MPLASFGPLALQKVFSSVLKRIRGLNHNVLIAFA